MAAPWASTPPLLAVPCKLLRCSRVASGGDADELGMIGMKLGWNLDGIGDEIVMRLWMMGMESDFLLLACPAKQGES